MKSINRPICAVLLVTLLVSTACGNLAVPPPFEAAGPWPVEKGDRVEIVLKSGEKVEGRVEALDEESLTVADRRVERSEIDKMWLKPENAAGAAAEGLGVMVLVVVVALAVLGYMVSKADFGN